MVKEEKEGERLRRFESCKHHRREVIRNSQETLDEFKAVLSRQGALLYEMKRKGFGNPQI